MAEESFIRKIYLWANALFAATLPMDHGLFNIGLGMWILASIVWLVKTQSFSFRRLQRNEIAMATLLLFGAVSLGLAWSNDTKAGWFVVERMLLFIICPILMVGINHQGIGRQVMRYASVGLICGLLCMIIYSCIIATGKILNPVAYGLPAIRPHSLWAEINLRFSYHPFSQNAGIHAIYMAVYLTFGFFLTQELLRDEHFQKKAWKVFFKVLSVVFIFFLFLMKSANISFTFILLLLLFVIHRNLIKKSNQWVWSVAFGLGMAVMAVILLIKANALRQDLSSLLMVTTAMIVGLIIVQIIRRSDKNSWWPTPGIFMGLIMGVVCVTILIPQLGWFEKWVSEHPSNVSSRYWNWKSAVDLILESPFLGLGTGESSQALMERYEHYNFEGGLKWEYNEHSQYLRYWLDAGLLALFAFLSLAHRAYRKALKSNYFPFLALVLLTVLFCATESAMVRRHFFALFVYFVLLMNAVLITKKTVTT